MRSILRWQKPPLPFSVDKRPAILLIANSWGFDFVNKIKSRKEEKT